MPVCGVEVSPNGMPVFKSRRPLVPPRSQSAGRAREKNEGSGGHRAFQIRICRSLATLPVARERKLLPTIRGKAELVRTLKLRADQTIPPGDELPDRGQILRWLTEWARDGHVSAMQTLLSEIRQADQPKRPPSAIDQLAKRRGASDERLT